MNLIRFCVGHAVPVIVAVLLALLFGVIAMFGIPRQLTPTVEVPVIGVQVRYLGAAPEEIEREVVKKIEDQLNAVDGLRELTSSSAENAADIRMEFDWGTDRTLAGVDVINKLNLVRDLPDEADEPIVYFGEPHGYPIAFISLQGEGRTSDDMREYAVDTLQPFLKRVSGVSLVDVYGGRERQVEVTFDPYKLAAYQLTPMDLARILAAENRNTRGGRIEEDKNRWVVRTVGEFRTAADVEQVVLRRPGMPDVRLGELLKADQQSFKDAEYYVRTDGKPGIVFAVQKKTGENVVEIMKGERGIYATIDTLNREILARQKMRMEVVYDESQYIDDSVAQLQENVILCAVLAGLVLVFFLRNGWAILTIVLAIPVSFVTTFVFLWMMGRTLNVISLAGLAFAVGMLVDNSIVVLENIYRHREMGKSARQAALDGAGEVWLAVAASTLTTVAVFIPIVFIQEEAGQLFQDICLAVAFSVSLSLIVSVTVIPMLAARILRTAKAVDPDQLGWGGWVGRYVMLGWFGHVFRQRVVGLVRWLVQGTARRWAAVVIILGVFGGATVYFAATTPATYLPTGNRNFVIGFVVTEAGASIDHNLDIAKEIEGRVSALPGVQKFFVVTLADQIFFGVRAADADKAREMAARIQACLGNGPPDFLPAFVREAWWKANGAFYHAPIAGVGIYAQQVGLFQRRGFLGGQTVSVTVRGDDIQRLYRIAGAMKDRLQATEGVAFVNPSFKLGNWELRPTPDRKRAADVGLTAADLGFAVGALVNGMKVADFREEGGKEIDLTLRGAPEFRRHIERLADVPLWTPRGGIVALGQVAPVLPAAGFNVIEHTEQQRSVQLDCAIQEGAAISQVIKTIEEGVVTPLRNDKTIPDDYVVEMRGTARDLALMWNALKWSFVLAMVICYLLMAALFESFTHPFVIMLSVPTALAGGYGALYLMMLWNGLVMKQPPPQLDVVTMLGFVMMIGIIVNNAILVVAQAINFMREGNLPLNEAVVASVDSRLRPIFMSTLTSILGMLPLVLRPGPGSELYQGLGAVIVGGLAVSTIFTLILTPVLFTFGYRFMELWHGLLTRLHILVPESEGGAPGGGAGGGA
jgi:HAE1 family hydrophobic/amphiphilic exporter-1